MNCCSSRPQLEQPARRQDEANNVADAGMAGVVTAEAMGADVGNATLSAVATIATDTGQAIARTGSKVAKKVKSGVDAVKEW